MQTTYPFRVQVYTDNSRGVQSKRLSTIEDARKFAKELLSNFSQVNFCKLLDNGLIVETVAR